MARLPRHDAAMRQRLERARARGKVLRYVGRLTCERAGRDARGHRCGDGRSDGARGEASLRQHRAHRQRGALRYAPLLRQSAHRPGAGGRTRGHGRGCVRRPAAPLPLTLGRDFDASMPSAGHRFRAGVGRQRRNRLRHSGLLGGGAGRSRHGEPRRDEQASRSPTITGVAGTLPTNPAQNTAGPRVARHAGGAAPGLRLRDADRQGDSARLRPRGLGRLGRRGGGGGQCAAARSPAASSSC